MDLHVSISLEWECNEVGNIIIRPFLIIKNNFSKATKVSLACMQINPIGYILKKYLHKRHLNLRESKHSLVHTGIVSLVSWKAEHAADDPAVHLSPVIITDLLPFASILHLHVALCHWDALTI